MNLKKTLAGVCAGALALSMATVAVSAKTQAAVDKKWDTKVVKSTTNTTSVGSITTTGATAAGLVGKTIYLTDGQAYANGHHELIKVTKVTSIRYGATTTTLENMPATNLKLAHETSDFGGITINKGIVEVDAAAVCVITFEFEAIGKVATDSIAAYVEGTTNSDNVGVLVTGTKYADLTALMAGEHTTGAATITDAMLSNKKADDDKTVKGVLCNDAKAGIEIFDLDEVNDAYWVNKGKNINCVSEIADAIKDTKGATISFKFDTASVKAAAGDQFTDDFDRYDWSSAADAMTLRVNSSNVLSKAQGEFNKETFTMTWNWDDVVGESSILSAAGLVRTMSLKINNDKLPVDEDDKIIDLRLIEISVKAPAMEIEDKTTVSDYAAGEAETTVEAALPTGDTTTAAAADAPVAADTTAAATNPVTGNSALALVAIPVALAAAAIVAKKRG